MRKGVAFGYVLPRAATVGALNGFDRWLNAIKIEETERPVPLTEYALTPDGSLFTYDQKTRRVQVAGQFTMSAGTPLASAVQNLLADDKQVLVFQTQVADTEDNARALASVLPVMKHSQELFAALSELDDSEGKAALENCVPHGVAFHNGGLSLEERSVVRPNRCNRSSRFFRSASSWSFAWPSSRGCAPVRSSLCSGSISPTITSRSCIGSIAESSIGQRVSARNERSPYP